MKSELETIDLDTLWDWQIAEAVLAKTESERSLH
jgi:hypothetical protein